MHTVTLYAISIAILIAILALNRNDCDSGPE
jgi:hypothetical protein